MPKTKTKKQEIFTNLKDQLAKMKAAVFVNFSGIPVKEINSLRVQCRDEQIDYTVVKKSLFKKVLAETGHQDVDVKKFNGEIAALFGFADEVAPAKLVKKFAKDHNKMNVLGGILEGGFIDDAKVTALAKLPARPELLAKMVGSIAAPLSGLVNVLQGNLRGLVNVLNAVKEKKA